MTVRPHRGGHLAGAEERNERRGPKLRDLEDRAADRDRPEQPTAPRQEGLRVAGSRLLPYFAPCAAYAGSWLVALPIRLVRARRWVLTPSS